MTTSVTSRADLARTVAAAATGVPGVARLVSSGPVEVATQFPGGRVPGVRLAADRVEVHLALNRLPAPPVAAAVTKAVRAALAGAGDDRPVALVVADVDEEAVKAALATAKAAKTAGTGTRRPRRKRAGS